MEYFDYQIKVINKAVNYFEQAKDGSKGFNIFYKMGYGKTLMAIGIINHMKPKSVIVICPKSLIGMWDYNLAKYLDFRYTYLKLDSNWNNIDSVYPKVTVINYEFFLTFNGKVDADIVVFDEVHKLKNVNSKLHTRIFYKVNCKYPICMTGTPIVRDYMDLFGILTCCKHSTFNGLTATRFRYKYVVASGTYTKTQLFRDISMYTVMQTEDEEARLHLPDYEDIVIPITLTTDEMTAHNKAATDISKKSLARCIECQQITSGIKLTKNNQKSSKLIACELLINDLLEQDEKIVIFTKYTNEFEYFCDRYKDICVGICGDTKDRDTPVAEFNSNDNIKIFVGNLQVASLGIKLTAANKCIFYSETFKWGDYEQARKRIHRIGQNRFCTYYHLIATNTTDVIFYNSNIYKTNLIEEFEKHYGKYQDTYN